MAADALRPGGRLVFASLAHYLNGEPAEADAVHADPPARLPDGGPTTMRRWVLQEPVSTKLLAEAGFTGITIDVLRASGGAQPADTLLVTAFRRSRVSARHGTNRTIGKEETRSSGEDAARLRRTGALDRSERFVEFVSALLIMTAPPIARPGVSRSKRWCHHLRASAATRS